MLLCLLLLFSPLSAADPGVEWARVVQEQVPQWQARLASAQARAEAATDYFEGRRPLVEAFPDLAGAPLDSPAWLSGQLDQLDARGAARAAERYAASPELQNAWQEQQRRQALEAALDTEDRADGLERRLLLGLRQLLTDHPALRREAMEAILAPLRAQIDAADAVSADAGAAALAIAGADAAIAGQELQRFAALLTELRHAATARAPSPSPQSDLARLSNPETAELARQRLELMAPFLGPTDREALDQALTDFATGVQLPRAEAALAAARADLERLNDAPASAVDSPATELEAALSEAKRQVIRAQALLDAQGDSPSPLAEARRREAALALELAQVRQGAAELSLSRAQDTSRQAREKAEETRAEAEAARQEADGAGGQRSALLEILAGAQSRTAELSATQAQRRAAQREQLDTLETELETIAGDIEAARALTSALDIRKRQVDLDQAYRALRHLISALRSETQRADSALREPPAATPDRADERSRVQALLAALGSETPEGSRSPEAIAGEWAAELDRQDELVADRALQAREHRDAVVHALQRARLLRRDLRGEVSPTELDEDRARLVQDVRQELALLGPSLSTVIQDRVGELRRLPGRMLRLSWLSSALLGSAWLLVVALVWSYTRRRSREVVHWALDRWAEHTATPYRRSELHAVEAPAIPTVVALIDLALGYALYEPVRQAVAELGLLLLIYLQIATFRLLLNLFDLAVARYPSLRPALLTLADRPRDHARRTVKVLALWGIASQFADYLTLEVLETDALNELTGILSRWGFVLIATWLLHLWEPDFRAALAQRVGEHRLSAWLSQPPLYALERAPRALVGGALLLGRGLWNLVDLRATDRSGLGRLLNYINRRRLSGDEAGAPAPPVPSQLRAHLTRGECLDDWFIQRPDADEQFSEAVTRWMRERRAGRVVLIGDRGDGKGCWLDRRCAGLEPVGWRVTRAKAERRLITERDMVDWLARLLYQAEPERQGPIPEDTATLIAALMELPGQFWVIQGLERTFLRTVGGFQAIRALFQVIQQCSEHHFWVLGVHRPAWRYLSRLSALFDTRFFRAEIELTPLREAQLQDLIERRMAGTGLRVDYHRLERPGLAGGDPEVERDRAARTFFRMLSESTQGNAAVALRYWADCLTPGEPGAVQVQLPGSARSLLGLSDLDLFVLTAVRIQEALDEAELSQVINLAPSVIRAAVRSLLDRQLLEPRDGGRVGVPLDQLPGVTLLLRRRHFLQGA